MTDAEQIERFLAERGATKCPPKAAAVLGESTPGWRRKAEYKAEKIGGKAFKKHQRALRRRK
jgi:hypothetical protein